MQRLRELYFAPLWVVVLVAGAAIWGFTAVKGFDWFTVPFAAFATITVGIGVAMQRKRFGGRQQMKRFYDAVRTRELPVIDSAADAVRWNRLIIDERAQRRTGLTLSWIFLALGAFTLILSAYRALTASYPVGLDIWNGVILIAVFAWPRLTTPRFLTGLEALTRQGTERGYGHWLIAS